MGNLMVLLMAYKRSNHMKPPEYLSVNLAVTDLGAAVTIYPLAVASAWNHHWIGGNVTCVYYGLMGFFFGAASMMTLTIMAIIRFIVSLTLQSPSEFPWALSLDLYFLFWLLHLSSDWEWQWCTFQRYRHLSDACYLLTKKIQLKQF